jgi:hypothetical protein
VFSNGFSEGQARDIDEGFPPDALPYTESYDYLSDSDLEDDEPGSPRGDCNLDTVTLVEAPENPEPEPREAGEVEARNVSALNFIQPP